MKIAVDKLHANPFRHIERYPIDEGKIEALMTSIEQTSFWDNLVARKAPNGTGGYQIAYGHHRREALNRLKIKEIDIPVKELSDDLMLKIMAHENMVEWGHNALVEQETVRAVVDAVAEGKVALEEVDVEAEGEGGLRGARIAPSFATKSLSELRAAQHTLIYTVESVRKFLSWKEWKVRAALDALALVDENLASEEQFKDLTTRQAQEVTKQTRRILKETDNSEIATIVGRKLADDFRSTSDKKVKSDKDGTSRVRKTVTTDTAKRAANEYAEEIAESK